MRFIAAILLALSATVLGAAVSERQVVNCQCLVDKNGDTGTKIQQSGGAYTCAYKGGACQYDSVGVLQNTKQTNCRSVQPCV